MALTKLGHLAEVKKKIASGKPVSIGVFCTGNSDRSPLARAVIEKRFRDLGFNNVAVFSFGVAAQSGKGSSSRTVRHAAAMGYDLSRHRSTTLSEALPQVKKADLLFAISPSHLAVVAEIPADDPREAGLSKEILRKGWSLVGFANKKEWTKRWRLLAGGIARGLSVTDPYGLPETSEGDKEWRKRLDNVERLGLNAVKRLTGRPLRGSTTASGEFKRYIK